MKKLIAGLAIATLSLTACKSQDKMAVEDASQPNAKPACCAEMKSCEGKMAECPAAKAECQAKCEEKAKP